MCPSYGHADFDFKPVTASMPMRSARRVFTSSAAISTETRLTDAVGLHPRIRGRPADVM